MGQALSSPDIIPNAAVTPCAGGSAGSEPECLVSICNQRRWVLREVEGSSLGILPSPPRGVPFGQDPPFLPKHKGRKPGPCQSCPQTKSR